MAAGPPATAPTHRALCSALMTGTNAPLAGAMEYARELVTTRQLTNAFYNQSQGPTSPRRGLFAGLKQVLDRLGQSGRGKLEPEPGGEGAGPGPHL